MATRKSEPVRAYVRIRPNEHEIEGQKIFEVLTDKEVFVKQPHGNKKYRFDGVLKSRARQLEVYETVVAPLIPSVLEGHVCTVIAFGQRGSGKTYTLHGEVEESLLPWMSPYEAGCISRALGNLLEETNNFDKKVEHTIRVSFLELYNEEIFDFLQEDYDENTPFRVIEDPEQKGSVFIQNLTLTTISGLPDIHRVLKRAQDNEKRTHHDADHSHQIFCINVHQRVVHVTNEETMKTGKLYFVELASSESFAQIRPKGQMGRDITLNISMQTFNSVVKALAERESYVPYKESKLTRILQDSLVRGKLSVIATVTSNNEETINTLEYVKNMKSIIMYPEISKCTAKSNIINLLNAELDGLHKDLLALRSGSGFFVDAENYNQLKSEIELKTEEQAHKSDLIADLDDKIQKLEIAIRYKKRDLDALQKSFNVTKSNATQYKRRLVLNERKAEKHKKVYAELEKRTRDVYEQRDELVSVGSEVCDDYDAILRRTELLYEGMLANDRRSEELTGKLRGWADEKWRRVEEVHVRVEKTLLETRSSVDGLLESVDAYVDGARSRGQNVRLLQSQLQSLDSAPLISRTNDSSKQQHSTFARETDSLVSELPAKYDGLSGILDSLEREVESARTRVREHQEGVVGRAARIEGAANGALKLQKKTRDVNARGERTVEPVRKMAEAPDAMAESLDVVGGCVTEFKEREAARANRRARMLAALNQAKERPEADFQALREECGVQNFAKKVDVLKNEAVALEISGVSLAKQTHGVAKVEKAVSDAKEMLALTSETYRRALTETHEDLAGNVASAVLQYEDVAAANENTVEACEEFKKFTEQVEEDLKVFGSNLNWSVQDVRAALDVFVEKLEKACRMRTDDFKFDMENAVKVRQELWRAMQDKLEVPEKLGRAKIALQAIENLESRS